jgi:predicted aspartyl protease
MLEDMKVKNLKFEIVKEPEMLSIKEKTCMKIKKVKEVLESIFNIETTLSVQEMNSDGVQSMSTQSEQQDVQTMKLEEIHVKNELFDNLKIEDFENAEQVERELIKVNIEGNPVNFLLDSGSDTQIMLLELFAGIFPKINVDTLTTSIIKVASDKLVKINVAKLSYSHKGIMLTNVQTHIVYSEINIVGRTLMKKLGYSIKYTPPKTEPMINEKFYTEEELAEIKELLPEIFKIVEKLEKYRGLSKIRPMKINFTNGIKLIWIRQRFLSDKDIKLFMDTITKFMELGLVRELTSEEMYGNFNFQILKVPKSNGEFSVLLNLHSLRVF